MTEEQAVPNDCAITRALEQWRITAVHEAGHAVVGELLGFPCRYIKGPLWMHDRRSTKGVRSHPRTDRARKCHADYGVASAAGIAAESIYLGRKLDDQLRSTSGRGDYSDLAKIAERLVIWGKWDISTDRPHPVRSIESLIGEWESRALDMLKKNWEWVEQVYELFILEEGNLSGDDVRACRPSVEVVLRD